MSRCSSRRPQPRPGTTFSRARRPRRWLFRRADTPAATPQPGRTAPSPSPASLPIPSTRCTSLPLTMLRRRTLRTKSSSCRRSLSTGSTRASPHRPRSRSTPSFEWAPTATRSPSPLRRPKRRACTSSSWSRDHSTRRLSRSRSSRRTEVRTCLPTAPSSVRKTPRPSLRRCGGSFMGRCTRCLRWRRTKPRLPGRIFSPTRRWHIARSRQRRRPRARPRPCLRSRPQPRRPRLSHRTPARPSLSAVPRAWSAWPHLASTCSWHSQRQARSRTSCSPPTTLNRKPPFLPSCSRHRVLSRSTASTTQSRRRRWR
mmetsp:Transcript_2824/g.10232  ORF Transcript_2824/g.10232 Transcript_2824/m.10232 type:complete len:313 (+) Transcript_2824:2024-2962(+)